MLKKSVKCVDFDGNPYEKDCYFNLTESELIEFEASVNGRVTDMFDKILKETDVESIMREFKKFFLMCYGEKSLDGRNFVKNERVLEDFISSPAYDQIFMELCKDPEAQIAFVQGVMPESVRNGQDFKQAVQNLPGQQEEKPPLTVVADNTPAAIPTQN